MCAYKSSIQGRLDDTLVTVYLAELLLDNVGPLTGRRDTMQGRFFGSTRRRETNFRAWTTIHKERMPSTGSNFSPEPPQWQPPPLGEV